MFPRAQEIRGQESVKLSKFVRGRGLLLAAWLCAGGLRAVAADLESPRRFSFPKVTSLAGCARTQV
jgi:hypothetical protein